MLLAGDLLMLVGERKRGFGAAGWCVWLLLFILKVNFHPFAASLC